MRNDNPLHLEASVRDIHEARNAQRLRYWRVQWYLRYGTWPINPEQHGNSNVIKFPRYRGQFL